MGYANSMTNETTYGDSARDSRQRRTYENAVLAGATFAGYELAIQAVLETAGVDRNDFEAAVAVDMASATGGLAMIRTVAIEEPSVVPIDSPAEVLEPVA